MRLCLFLGLVHPPAQGAGFLLICTYEIMYRTKIGNGLLDGMTSYIHVWVEVLRVV